MFPGLCLHTPRKKKVWVPFQVSIKSSPMKSWPLYFQPALWAAKKALKNVHQIPSWRDRPWGYPKWSHKQWPQRLAPAGSARLFAFLSQAVQQLRSRQPPVNPRGVPAVGLRGEVPAGQTPSPCSALALLSMASQPPRSDEGSGRVGPGVGEPRGLHRTVERAKTYRIMIA